MNDKVKNIAQDAVVNHLYSEIENFLLEDFSIFTDAKSLRDHIRNDCVFENTIIKILKNYIEL